MSTIMFTSPMPLPDGTAQLSQALAQLETSTRQVLAEHPAAAPLLASAITRFSAGLLSYAAPIHHPSP